MNGEEPTSWNENQYALVCVDVIHDDVDRLFHYAIPFELFNVLQLGMRVHVPFGRGNKIIIGYVIDIVSRLPDHISADKMKTIAGVMDDFPVLTEETISLALWMKEKYYTTLALVVRCVTPAAKADGRFPMTRRKKTEAEASAAAVKLTAAQQSALDKILHLFNACHSTLDIESPQSHTLLLHGVTGSGKTEVYLHAISHLLNLGRQAIVLVPEIALTPQMVDLFTARFGSQVAVTHSRLTAGERFQIWKQALDGEISLVIGPRSAVFAPFKNLGLIVIDEEHEHTYHSETTPKYDARAVAMRRAKISGGIVVLGSATPSLESYYRAERNIYAMAELPTRINKTTPHVEILDMRLDRGNTSLFSHAFQDALAETIETGKQAILFLNRRGHSSFVSCRWCGHVLSCEHCRVNHTYHADKNRLLCHYCGKGMPLPSKCPACGSEHIRRTGLGTQKVEEEVLNIFPTVKTLRMDMDTTRGKHGHAKILDAFRRGEAQVLIGTQMVAKGLDFPNVTLVGVVAADFSLFTGDFRAGEYTFQLLTQVSGRAGRASHTGRVFLQTYNPHHYALTFAKTADYKAFYTHEIALRRAMKYPPFSHVFAVMFTGKNEREVIVTLQKLAAIMEYTNKRDNKNRFELIGISPAFVSKIKNQFRWKLLVKCQEDESLKAFVLYCIRKLKENDPLTGITINLTLDPIVMD